MNKIEQMHKKARRGEAPRLTSEEIADLKSLIPEWKIVDIGGVPRLEREYEFEDFAQALAFTNKIGYLAEAEQHHPKLVTQWGRVKVSWWTHDAKGLTRHDFELAAKTDESLRHEPAKMSA